jgi:hypothetical protein
VHPENFAVKRLVRQFKKEREVVLYLDLHGHSRKKNIFIYGNNFVDSPHQTRVFPYIMSKLCDCFSFEDSRFSNYLSKESTARVAMWRELQIPNVFTLEASFCGADIGELQDQHFNTENLMQAGQSVLMALLIYCKIDVDKKIAEFKTKQGDPEIAPMKAQTRPAFVLADVERELKENKQLIEMTAGDEEGEGDAGSDSEPSEDNMDEAELAEIVPLPKKQDVVEPPPKPVAVQKAKKLDPVPKVVEKHEEYKIVSSKEK